MKPVLLFVFYMFSSRQLLIAQAPVNDECTGAISITLSAVGSSCTQAIDANTASATRSLPNPSCTSSLNDDDIWYSFQAVSTGIVLRVFNAVYNSSGQTAQIGFALYRGNCPATTSTLACSNIVSAGAGYLAVNQLVPGDVYYLRFWSASSTEAASFQFCVQQTDAPVNDECANAEAIITQPEGTVCDAGYHVNTTGASRSMPNPGCTSFNDDDVWYSFVAGANGVRLNFSNAAQVLSGGNANIGYALHPSSCAGAVISCAGTIGNSSGSELIGGLVPGNRYLLRLFSYATNAYTSFDFCLVDETIVINDECSDAVELTVTNGFASLPQRGSLFSATASAGFGPPSCTALSSSEDVWFKAVVPSSGSIHVQTAAAVQGINDLVMEAYAGNCNTLNLVACDDNSNPNAGPSANHSLISLSGRQPGETVYLRVLGKGTINNGAFIIAAWDPAVLPAISGGGNCLPAAAVTIDTTNGNQYTWVPVLDAAGNIAAELYANGNSPGIINTAIFVNSSGTVQASGGKFYLDRHLAILPSDTLPVKMRIYIKQAELAALQAANPLVTDPYHLQVLVSSNACDEPRSASVAIIYPDTARLYNGDFYIEFETNQFGSFYIERQETVVPVTLASYTAACTDGKAAIRWTTSGETNNAYYSIERSEDGSTFKPIGTVKPAGIAAGAGYTFYDELAGTEKRWYRLVQVDKDGRKHFYRIIPLVCEQSSAVQIYPNPAGNVLHLKLPGDAAFTALEIFDMHGKLLVKKLVTNAASNTMQLDTGKLPDGLYVLRLQKKNGDYLSKKITKSSL